MQEREEVQSKDGGVGCDSIDGSGVEEGVEESGVGIRGRMRS